MQKNFVIVQKIKIFKKTLNAYYSFTIRRFLLKINEYLLQKYTLFRKPKSSLKILTKSYHPFVINFNYIRH